MKSLGVIETRGLVTAIQAVDAACKSAGVVCIGYRKIGSGLVTVCFEGEISAIHTAIERGVAAVAQPQVKSLVIARPEPCVVKALSGLKGYPPLQETNAGGENVVGAITTPLAPQHPRLEPSEAPQVPTVPSGTDEKNTALKKGKKT